MSLDINLVCKSFFIEKEHDKKPNTYIKMLKRFSRYFTKPFDFKHANFEF